MTEYELAEYLTTLLGFNAEGGSSELQEFDVNTAGDIIDQNLPHHITGDMFANEVLGFSMYNRELPSARSQSQDNTFDFKLYNKTFENKFYGIFHAFSYYIYFLIADHITVWSNNGPVM